MGLHDLRAVHQFAQLSCRRRNAHRHDRIASFGRSEQMADRADPAYARSDAWHLIERAPLGELLKSSHLGHVKLGACDSAAVVQLIVIFACPSIRVTGSMVMRFIRYSSLAAHPHFTRISPRRR